MADRSPEISGRPADWTAPSFYGRLSTGLKMLLILSFALLPLGLISVFASRESAHVNRLRHEAEARAAATASASAITDALTPATLGMRQSLNDIAASAANMPIDKDQCRIRLEKLDQGSRAISGIAMYNSGGRQVCATRSFAKVPAYLPSDEIGFDIRVVKERQLLLTTIASANGRYFGIAEFPARAITTLLPSPKDTRPGVVLRQGSQAITLRQEQSSNPIDQIISVVVPVAGGQLGLEMRMPAAPLATVDVLLILMPILMWAAGGIIGWIVVERLLLRPLGQMQRAIAVFSRGEGPLALPRLKTPAREIRELGESFLQATETLTAHENELAEGLANQKRLTREVHHRVKNNLQVVSSLINLHSRGAASDAVTEAYASIQRRVDALAVVHRNHYAELEDHQGVSLRALIGEIASNLRASATQDAMHTAITLNIMSGSANQDVAVPIAFLITEIVELVMICGPRSNVAISLTPVAGNPARGLLSISSPSLANTVCLEGAFVERFQRIAGGLARQLRAPLDHDVAGGRYAIEIPIMRA
jgi:two-component system, sensor histidine kinase PdtaS